MKQIKKQKQERDDGIGSGGQSIGVGSAPSPSVDADELHASLEEIADSFDVSGFKCTKCGLAHTHDTTKHRLSDDYDIDEADVTDMEYNSVCHCGLQEAGRHGSDIGIDEQDAAKNASKAPIPPEASREMNESFGSL
jgi:hypothetical protein